MGGNATGDFSISGAAFAGGIDFAPTGGSLRIEYTFNYDTGGNTVYPDTGIYVSQDAIFDETDVFLGTDYVGNTNGVGTSSENYYLSIPSTVAQGTYYLFLDADHYDDLSESNEGNNLSDPVAFQVTNNPSLYANLTTSNLVFDLTNYASDGSISYSFDYANNGIVDAGDMYVQIQFGEGSAGGMGRTEDSIDWYIGSLDAGETGTQSGTIYLDDDIYLDPETYHAQVEIYVGGDQNEVNKADNYSNVVEFTVDGGAENGRDQGTHVGWYYEIDAVQIESIDYYLGWYNDWHTEYGWHVGWPR